MPSAPPGNGPASRRVWTGPPEGGQATLRAADSFPGKSRRNKGLGWDDPPPRNPPTAETTPCSGGGGGASQVLLREPARVPLDRTPPQEPAPGARRGSAASRSRRPLSPLLRSCPPQPEHRLFRGKSERRASGWSPRVPVCSRACPPGGPVPD